MQQELQQILSSWITTKGASAQSIDVARQALGVWLPPDYAEVIMFSNGCEGFAGRSYLRLYPIDNLARLNAAFGVQEFAPDLVIFGSSGGGEVFAFDTRTNPVGIVQLPFIPMVYEYIVEHPQSFTEFLLRLAQRDRDDQNPLPTQVNPATVGKEIHEITPIVFGGSPTDPSNKAYLTTEQYAEYVVWWNRMYRNVRAQKQSG